MTAHIVLDLVFLSRRITVGATLSHLISSITRHVQPHYSLASVSRTFKFAAMKSIRRQKVSVIGFYSGSPFRDTRSTHSSEARRRDKSFKSHKHLSKPSLFPTFVGFITHLSGPMKQLFSNIDTPFRAVVWDSGKLLFTCRAEMVYFELSYSAIARVDD